MSNDPKGIPATPPHPTPGGNVTGGVLAPNIGISPSSPKPPKK